MWKLTRNLIRRAASGLPTKTGAKFIPRQIPASLSHVRAASTSLQLGDLAGPIREFVEEHVKLFQPAHVHVCDGSEEENKSMVKLLQDIGRLKKLDKYDNCYLAITSPEDVARVEKQTYVCTTRREDSVPTPAPGVESLLGNWKDPVTMDAEMNEKFQGSMTGRTMYVIPFSMGPLGSNLSKIGIQLTDSEYVVASMRIMTRMGRPVLDVLQDRKFIKCVHSVGYPLKEGEKDIAWPCNKKKIAIVQYPEKNEIKSFGSGYGGNSLLGKKCFALRIASTIARDEGWLAEHMLILGLTNPQGVKKYVAAAFPSACGKTNLAMLTPTIPGWKAECVGDDIAWMRFNEEGKLMAINPENGFFGVAPGTNTSSNPNAMGTIFKNTIFTNVAATSDGGVFWEGLEKEIDKDVSITSWRDVQDWQNLGQDEKKKKPAAHPNSRFCTPIKQCPIVDPNWENPRGVPIDAILFGGRRPKTIPLVYEANDWNHGVFVGASMRSEATSAASDLRKGEILHDPFAMRPFFGYNFSHYMQHWLNLQHRPKAQMPKIFHVNWFRKDDGKFMWPGFGDNVRVLDWIFRRCDGEDIAQPSPLGLIPKEGTINTTGLGTIDMTKLFEMSKEDLREEVRVMEQYFEQQLSGDIPQEIKHQLQQFKERVESM